MTEIQDAAQALGISTTEIFAVTSREGGLLDVIYTPGVTAENVETVQTLRVLLSLGADGVYRTADGPVEIQDFYEKVNTALKRMMRLMTGPEEENDGSR